MIVGIQSPPRLPMMQEQKSFTCRWLSCSGWGREHVFLVFSYKGSWFIRKGQWHTKVNILRLAVGYLNATMKRKSWNTEQEIGMDWSDQTQQNPRVDRYGSWFGPLRCNRSGFWTVLEPNRTSFAVQTRTAGRLPRPVAITTHSQFGKCLLTTLAWQNALYGFRSGMGKRAIESSSKYITSGRCSCITTCKPVLTICMRHCHRMLFIANAKQLWKRFKLTIHYG